MRYAQARPHHTAQHGRRRFRNGRDTRYQMLRATLRSRFIGLPVSVLVWVMAGDLGGGGSQVTN